MKRLFPEHEAAPAKAAFERPTVSPKPIQKAQPPANPLVAPAEQLTKARKAWLNGKLDEAKVEDYEPLAAPRPLTQIAR